MHLSVLVPELLFPRRGATDSGILCSTVSKRWGSTARSGSRCARSRVSGLRSGAARWKGEACTATEEIGTRGASPEFIGFRDSSSGDALSYLSAVHLAVRRVEERAHSTRI